MNQSDKARFILALHKHSLQAFDNGGVAGAIGGVLGLNNNFQAAPTTINAGTNAGQLATAYGGTQNALTNQNNLVGTVAPLGTTGVGTELGLTNTLQNEVAGNGPSPAQAALNQATRANVANTQALIASARGASANPALIARQAAMAGAQTEQNSAGQAATLKAQEQLAAQGQLQNLAATQIAQNAGAVTAQNQAEQSEQGILQGANSAANNANVTMQSNINNVNSGVSEANQQMAGKTVGGLLNGAATAASFLAAKGGDVKNPISHAGKWFALANTSPKLAATGGKVTAPTPSQKAVKKDNSYSNDKVPSLLSEGEIVIPRSITMHPMAAQKAAQFVQATLNKRKMAAA